MLRGRLYSTSRMVMTKAMSGGLTRGHHAALGEELDNGAWARRLYYKPLLNKMWARGTADGAGRAAVLAGPLPP